MDWLRLAMFRMCASYRDEIRTLLAELRMLYYYHSKMLKHKKNLIFFAKKNCKQKRTLQTKLRS